MLKKNVRGWLTAALLASSFWIAPAVQAESIGREVEIKPTLPIPSNDGIDLSRDYAVWLYDNDESHAIIVYDLDDEQVLTKIAASGARKASPKVDGDYVVWIDYRRGDGDVYLYDLDDDRETRITTGDIKPVELEIEGDTIVWTGEHEDMRDVYAYSMKSGKTRQLSWSGSASHPTVYGSYVAWEDHRNGHADIYAYDLSADREMRVTTNSDDQTKPSLYGSEVVYEDDRHGTIELYIYDLKKQDEDRLTDGNDDRQNPRFYGDYIVYENDGDLEYIEVDDDRSERIARNFESKIGFGHYDEFVLFAKEDSEGNPRLYLYDIDEDETLTLERNGEPSEPDADDWHVVYISKGEGVVLYNVETKESEVISAPEQDPSRPLVSGNWVVYYDEDEDALYSYNITTGKRKQVTDEDEASDTLYELYGNQLVWVDDDRIYLTNLSTGDTIKIDDLSRAPRNLDINSEYILWTTNETGYDSEIYLYDLKKGRDTRIHRGQALDAHLGDDFVIWSERESERWNLYYYDLDRERIYSLFGNAPGDQEKPQASRNAIIYQDNSRADKGEYFYQLYDMEEHDYISTLSEEAKPSDLRMGGNRIVWVDERDDTETLYMMAFAQPSKEKPEEEPEGPGDGEEGEYKFWDVVAGGKLVDIVNSNPWDKIYFVFYADSKDEFEISLYQFIDNSKTYIEHINDTPRDNLLIRVYK
ncbi:MAG: PQQ-binding-like beta-propeller repeat protein [Brevibacillus sp.]|nr:PQQ-binding-like beta-propeller repeat protein [Brevibacillus sp.]